MKSDLEIARETSMRPIVEIAQSLGIAENEIVRYGDYVAKIPAVVSRRFKDGPKGKLVLVTAMTPTPQGEGKTTNTIGLGQALCKLGKKAVVAIREPSLGPCMGLKGGAAGGGYSQVLPMEDINLHFTGDMHAVSAAHNLLSAIIDNHLHQKNVPELNARRIIWKRVIDMNDRSLRVIVVGLLGSGINGVMREDGFEITAASEIMAILCLASDIADLKMRIGRIIVGHDSLGKPITVADLGVAGAMTALLKHAINPNLVQSVEGMPVFVHGGPFANIAHGCNSLIATTMAIGMADYAITEAGFGADLGAEKFFNITCRTGDLEPSAAVLVVTRRAFAAHGIDNVQKHVENIRLFGIPVAVSINRFSGDPSEELEEIRAACIERGIDAEITDFREQGGEGGLALAELVCRLSESQSTLIPLYNYSDSIADKIETIAAKIYGATHVEFTSEARKEIKQVENLGYGALPICMAKTQSSLSDNPRLTGRPHDFSITVTGARVCAGAGFVVVYTGKIMTMPGLPKIPSALNIDIDDRGTISGLF